MLGSALAELWRFPPFHKAGRARVTDGTLGGERVVIVKPETYMNRSGAVLAPLLELPDFDIEGHLLVLVDEYQLPLGTFRLRARGSTGGHNGLESIERALGSQVYSRLRIGVGPLPEDEDDPADFVLSRLSDDEMETLNDLLGELGDAVECWFEEGVESAMNKFNRRGKQSD